MHRSGTSALCGALDRLGVDFGRQLMPATDWNAKGHWEHQEIVDLHDALLYAHGSRWDDDEPLPDGWADADVTRDTRERLLAILERDFRQSSLFGIKDPRMCRLLALWRQVFEGAAIEPHYAILIRHPSEIAESLAKRDGIDNAKSCLMWLDHVLQAESETRGALRSFVGTQISSTIPLGHLLNCGRVSRSANSGSRQTPRPSLRDFVDPMLRHHRVAPEQRAKLGGRLGELAAECYEAIANAGGLHEIETRVEPLAARFRAERERLYPRRGRMKKLSPEDVCAISLRVGEPPRDVQARTTFSLRAEVANGSGRTLSSLPPYPVRLAYHWLDGATREGVVFEGTRSGFSSELGPNATTQYPMSVAAPDAPGSYILQTTMVQDGVCWFEDIRPDIVQEFAVAVIAAAPAAPAITASPQLKVAGRAQAASVTVGVPIYRGQEFLAESLASVQNQTHTDIDVLMSLDGPDDACETICRAFLEDERFQLVVQPRRLGWMEHTNWLMERVETEFWHLQEQDDVLEPHFLETLVGYARAHGNVAAAFGDVRTFGTMDTHMEMSSVLGTPVMRQMKVIYEHFPGVAPLGLIRTEALRRCGGLKANEFENFAADTALMAGLARSGELHRIPQELYRKRVHATSTHATWWDWPMEKRFGVWQVHCLDMLEHALAIEATPQDYRLLWLGCGATARLAGHRELLPAS
jgi:GT2 family glycosyltransferase